MNGERLPTEIGQSQFYPNYFSKEEELIFYGQRPEDNNPFPEKKIQKSLSSKFFHDNTQTVNISMMSINSINCCQYFLIPYQNRLKSYFDVFMMFLVTYSVFTTLF